MKAKNNQYFLKDKKAQIYREADGGRDENGFSIPGGFYPYAAAPMWCYSKQLSAELTFVAHTYDTDETRLFVFNYKPKVKQYDLILYRGKWYEITRVDTTDDYKGEMFIYVKDCPGGGISKDSNLQPYDPTKWE